MQDPNKVILGKGRESVILDQATTTNAPPIKPIDGHEVIINGNADATHCAGKGCGKSLIVSERRKRIKAAATWTDRQTGRKYHLCRKCWRKERAS